MSVLNQSGEEQVECPLCMEPLEVDDLHFYPCTCGYQICRFCWNRIREGENGLCPACRKAYPENPADFTPLSQEQVAAIKTEKKAREAKRRNKTLESRRALANVRVVQNNLVFVVGLPVRLADPEILKRQEYFGKYGKIHKVVINQSTTYAGSQGPSASAYVTYVSPADALRAIQGVNNVTLDGRVLKGSLGTTKYCANFMKNQPCPKPDCMYLHELGDPKASFTKEEMHAGLHQVYERKLHNQLLQMQRDRPNEEKHSNTGNSSTIAEKGSSKDSNQSNFIPTTVVTSSHINNVVNSSKSKKESVNGNSGNSNGNSSCSSTNGKEAWPSLSSSPPSDSPASKQPSPKPTVKSQENGTSESSSPTQQSQQQQAQTKNSKNSNHTENSSKSNRSNRDASATNGQTSKRNKTEKSKQKSSSSIINSHNNNNNSYDISDMENLADSKQISDSAQNTTTETHTFEHDTQQEVQQHQQQQQQQSFLSSELDELESDRHSLLESRSPPLGERGLLDEEPHTLLDGLEARFSHPTLNGYSLPDHEITYAPRLDLTPLDRKELLLREQRKNEMIIRQNELLARHHAQSVSALVEPKHYMPTSSIGLDSTSELLGANFHSNPNMLPPFGMRIDNSMATNSLGANSSANAMTANSLAANSLAANSLAANSMSASGLSGNPLGGVGLPASYLPHPQQMLQTQQQIPQTGLVNGFDAQQTANEGRYLAENMEKFFTDFHKTQQMRLLLSRGASGVEERRYIEPHPLHYPHNMLSAERLELEHKQRMNNMLVKDMVSGRASGDGDDDLDFDPIKETQKALAEMMETEMMQNTVSSGDSMDQSRRCRLPPPGFGHVNAVNAYGGLGVPHPQTHHQGVSSGYNSSNAMFSDWTQMDPAIMSTSVNFGKSVPQLPPASTLSQQQRELFARFNNLGVQPNGVSKLHAPAQHTWPAGTGGVGVAHKWGAAAYANIPLPPGFAPAKPAQHPAECIDAK